MSAAEATLKQLLDRYEPAIAVIARAARASLRKQLPPAFEMVYDNWNALVIGYAPTDKTADAIVSIALYPRWVNLFFLFGAGLPDPDKLLKGTGKRVRRLVLTDRTAIDSKPVRTLVAAAVARAPTPFGQARRHMLSIRALSHEVRPRRPTSTKSSARGRS